MRIPNLPNLSPEQVLPLLEDALLRGESLAADNSLPYLKIRAWRQETSVLLSELHGYDSPAVKAFNNTGDLERKAQIHEDSGAAVNWSLVHKQMIVDAVVMVRVHTAILRAKAAPPAVGHLPSRRPGNRVFVGHGRSTVWLELRHFLEGRLGLAVEEFNGVSTAGRTTVERLKEMLDVTDFAFLIMTAEDDVADGSVRARQNVIHEIGLFQGRLGFDRAIILLEETCQKFSNVDGLTYIPFPKGNITAAYEKIRWALESAKILSAPSS